MSFYKRILIVVCALFLLTKSHGQIFKNITELNGLRLTTTLGITQDKQGFIWFGTEAGLFRYNSKTLTRIHNGKQNPKFIRDMATDAQGNIWIASTRSGLYRYQTDTDTFINFEPDSANANSLSHNSVNCVLIDQKKQIWAGTQHGLSRVVEDHGKWVITRHLQTEFSDQTLQVRSMCEDKAGNIWIATGDGLIKMNNDGSNPKLYRIPSKKTQTHLSELIFVYADNSGVIWLGSNGTGLYQFNPGTEEFKLIQTLKTPNGESARVSRMIADGKGKYWLATTSGLVHFDPVSLKGEWFENRPGDPNSLGNTMLFSAYLDRQGGLWCGSFYTGVSYLHFDSPKFKSWPFAAHDLRNQSYSNSWLGKGKAKQIWAMSDNMDKLLLYDANGKNPKTFNLKFSKEADYYAIYLDENDVLWAAGNSILTSVNLHTGVYAHYPLKIQGKPAPVNARTFAIFKDSSKRFWIGGYYGLLLFDQNQGIFTLQNAPNISVRSIYEDSQDNIWIGGSNEIYRVNPKHDSSVKPMMEKIIVAPKPAEYFWRIAEDPSGNIWAAGTTALYNYNIKTNRFEPNSDVPGGSIKDVIADQKGYLWLNAADRLYRYHPLQSYGYADGLPQNSLLTQGFGTSDANGNLYFMTNQGMFYFDPEEIRVNDKTTPIMLTSLKLYNQEVTTGDSTGLLPEPLWKTKALTFRHDQSIFSLDFALLDYVRSDNNQYAYKIEGIDRDWNYVQNPTATYTNLPSGTYMFQVKAANGDGFWMNEPLKIKILPPWWRTWYAYLFYLLLFGGVVYAVNRFFWLRSSFRKENALNQVKLEFFTNISHEIRTHLSLISGPLEKAHQQLQKLPASEHVERNLNYAKNSSDRLLLLVNELLDFRKIQSGGVHLQVREHDVVKIMKSILAAFEQVSIEKEIKTTLVCPDKPVLLWFDIAQMQKVFYNLLSNAYKFTPNAGSVWVRITEISNEVNITVEDSGNGISPGHLGKLFTYYYQVDAQKPGYGIGLALSKSIVEQHHGYLTAESRLATATAHGMTTLTIRLLTGASHFTPEQLDTKGADYVSGAFSVSNSTVAISSLVADKQKNTILIIEDNDELRAFICELFDGEFQVLQAENGLRGLEVANEQIPDIIISDVMMPEMNGLEVCRQLKGAVNTAHIPVILLTARTQSEQVIEGLEVGADDYLTKPFDPRVITLKINNLLRLRDDLKERYRDLILRESLNEESKVLDLKLDTPETAHSLARDVNEAFLARLKGVVSENMSNTDFGVNELAFQAGTSVSVLYRKMRSLTGMTINEFVKTIRLNEAKRLMESGVYQVGEVAVMVGFEDNKYFSKEFKKTFGKNPIEYKKEELKRV